MRRSPLQARLCLVIVLVLCATTAGGCVGSSEAPAAPRALDRSLAPANVLGEKYRLFENVDDATRKTFADAGPTSLVDDGAVWEIRRADKLVGTLQIATFNAKVDPENESQRKSVVNDIIPGGGTRIALRDQEVHTIAVSDRTIYLWFGQTVYEVLVLKGLDEGDDPEQVLVDVIAHQQTVSAWQPLVMERATS